MHPVATDKSVTFSPYINLCSPEMTVNGSDFLDKKSSMNTKNNTEDLEQQIADLESRLHNAKVQLASSPRSAKASSLSREPNGMLSRLLCSFL